MNYKNQLNKKINRIINKVLNKTYKKWEIRVVFSTNREYLHPKFSSLHIHFQVDENYIDINHVTIDVDGEYLAFTEEEDIKIAKIIKALIEKILNETHINKLKAKMDIKEYCYEGMKPEKFIEIYMTPERGGVIIEIIRKSGRILSGQYKTEKVAYISIFKGNIKKEGNIKSLKGIMKLIYKDLNDVGKNIDLAYRDNFLSTITKIDYAIIQKIYKTLVKKIKYELTKHN